MLFPTGAFQLSQHLHPVPQHLHPVPQTTVASKEERCLLSPFLPPSLAGTGIKSKVYEKMEGPREILIWSQAD